MARNLQAKLEAEADAKGLEGEERQRYIGGAWQHIRGKEQRSAFRQSDEAKHLSRYFGTVHEVREHKKRGTVILRQGREHYELPRGEYERLVKAGREAYVLDHEANRRILAADRREREETARQLAQVRRERERAQARYEREQQRAEAAQRRAQARHDKAAAQAAARAQAKAQREEARAIAFYERELAAEKREQEREARKRARQEEAYAAAQERDVRRFEREQQRDVRAIILGGGGIRRSVTASGVKHDTSEYNRNIPSDLRYKPSANRGRLSRQGMTADEAATAINDQMPWLRLEGANALYDYFERQQTQRYRRQAQRQRERRPALAASAAPRRGEARQEHAHEQPREPTPAPDWADIFGTPQPLPKEETPRDLFGGETSAEQQSASGKAHRHHTHLWEPWRNDWRFMRCRKCGAVERSTFGAGVSK